MKETPKGRLTAIEIRVQRTHMLLEQLNRDLQKIKLVLADEVGREDTIVDQALHAQVKGQLLGVEQRVREQVAQINWVLNTLENL